MISPGDLLHELLCCPRCRGPLRADASACEGCGAPCRREGPVLNFLGDGAFQLPAKNDVALAAWLLANRTHVASMLKGTGAPQANGGVDPDDVARMVASGPFLQILNDLDLFAEGKSAPSETVRFLLSRSEVGPDSRVLDAGCSCGRHLWELAGRSPRLLVGVDVHLLALTVGALAWQARGLPGAPQWFCASVLRLPFRDGSFTHAHSFVTLAAVPARAALGELARVLAPGGRLTLTVEGAGFWRSLWDGAPALSLKRVHLMRSWLGDRLLEFGLDWQGHPLVRKLSGYTQFTPATIGRLVRRAGFTLEACEVLRAYRGRPALIGVSAHKAGPERPVSAGAPGRRRQWQYA